MFPRVFPWAQKQRTSAVFSQVRGFYLVSEWGLEPPYRCDLPGSGKACNMSNSTASDAAGYSAACSLSNLLPGRTWLCGGCGTCCRTPGCSAFGYPAESCAGQVRLPSVMAWNICARRRSAGESGFRRPVSRARLPARAGREHLKVRNLALAPGFSGLGLLPGI
jgi:hypothetical protein